MNINKLQIGDIGFVFKKNQIIHFFIYMGDGIIAEATHKGIEIINLQKYKGKILKFKRLRKNLNPIQQQTIWKYCCDRAGITKPKFNILFKKNKNFVNEVYSLIDINFKKEIYMDEELLIEL